MKYQNKKEIISKWEHVEYPIFYKLTKTKIFSKVIFNKSLLFQGEEKKNFHISCLFASHFKNI